MTDDAEDPDRIVRVLEAARSQGFLGPGPVQTHIAHALGYLDAIGWNGPRPGSDPRRAPARILDLGSGGGIPGLVLADALETAEVVLLDSVRRRTDFLRWAVGQLDLSHRVRVLACRAEVAGRDAAERAHYDVVVARSFARPSVTAECGAPFLKVGGLLVVSEPPVESSEPVAPHSGKYGRDLPMEVPGSGGPPISGSGDQCEVERSGGRWPERELEQLGLVPGARKGNDFRFQVLRQVSACPDQFPRRVGVPAKRPLF